MITFVFNFNPMKTLVIKVDNNSSMKLFLDLAKKLHFKTRVLNETQKEDIALLSMMNERSGEQALPVQSAISNLKKVKTIIA